MLLRRRDRYKAQGRGFLFVFQSTALASHETVEVHRGIRGAGRSLAVQSYSKRPRTSSSNLSAVDSFQGVSFSRREGAYNRTRFVVLLKTFPCRLVTFSVRKCGISPFILRFGFCGFCRGRAAFHSSVRSEIQLRQRNVFHLDA